MEGCGIACGECPLVGMCLPEPADPAPVEEPVPVVEVADTDAPDIDPNEPRPADAGCCGGGRDDVNA